MCRVCCRSRNRCGTPGRRNIRSGSCRTSRSNTLGDDRLGEPLGVLMSHVVLLGDSIFDNAAYVPDRPPVIEQVRRGLPRGWKATLVAVDGHKLADIATQLPRVPADVTHIVV